MVTFFQAFVVKLQNNRDIFVQPLTYATNAQVNGFAGAASFRLLLSRNPSVATTYLFPLTTPSDLLHNVVPRILSSRHHEKQAFIREKVHSQITAAQKGYQNMDMKAPYAEHQSLQ